MRDTLIFAAGMFTPLLGMLVVTFVVGVVGWVYNRWFRKPEPPMGPIVTGVELSEDEHGIKLVGTMTDDFWVDNLRKFQAEQHHSLRYMEPSADPLANWEDIDIDYNRIAFHRDRELQDILEDLHNRPLLFTQYPAPNYDDIKPATQRPMVLVGDGIKIEPRYCGSLNPDPAYPYRCVRNRGHDQVPTLNPDEDHYARHGYAGMYWD